MPISTVLSCSRPRKRVGKISKDPWQPEHNFFQRLRSVRHYRPQYAKTDRHQNSFFSQANPPANNSTRTTDKVPLLPLHCYSYCTCWTNTIQTHNESFYNIVCLSMLIKADSMMDTWPSWLKKLLGRVVKCFETTRKKSSCHDRTSRSISNQPFSRAWLWQMLSTKHTLN